MGVDLGELKILSLELDRRGTIRAGLVDAAVAELRELRSRPAIPPWTTEKPTVPGWYVANTPFGRCLVGLLRDDSGRIVMEGARTPVTDVPDDAWWFGPLPEPPGDMPTRGGRPAQP